MKDQESGGDIEESNYPYVASRARARKARLLKADSYRKMLLMSVPEIGRLLGESEYRKEMAAFAEYFEGASLIEVATYRNMARMFKEVLGYCTSELRTMVASYLGKWDAYNVKVVLRGKYASVPAESIEMQLIPAGSFGIEFLRSLARMDMPEEMITAATRAGLPISGDALGSFIATKKLSTLEDEIDKGYYSKLLRTGADEEAKSVFISYVRKEIDVHNMQTVLRLKAEGLLPHQKMPYLLTGGQEFGPAALRQLIELPSVTDMLSMIRTRSGFADAFATPSGSVNGWAELRQVAIALDKVHAMESQRLERLFPLSVLPVLDYMLRKELEVKNIRIMARGKQSGLSEDEIRAVLVF